MMWNFLVGGLLAGSAIVLYDGHDPQRLWSLAEEAEVTCFGASAGFIGACLKAGAEPPTLPRLRSIGSTGSPLAVEAFEWVYRHFPDVWLFSTSGGTDLCTAFVGACAPARLRRRAPGPLPGRGGGGVDGEAALVEAVGARDHEADAVDAAVPLERPRRGALSRELLRHLSRRLAPRDWIKLTERGTAVIYGRSDSTINRAGVRMGTSEIYSAVEAVPEVIDSLVVDVEDSMLLFVVLSDGAELDDALIAAIRAWCASTVRPATCPIASWRWPRCRARCPARSSRCRSRRS